MTSQVDTFDGVRVTYDIFGAGSTGLLFGHGLGGNRDQWVFQTGYFGSRMRTVAVDLTGHGDSGRSRNTYSIKNFARDVAAVADALHLDEIILVGHSMGGAVILEALPDTVGDEGQDEPT